MTSQFTLYQYIFYKWKKIKLNFYSDVKWIINRSHGVNLVHNFNMDHKQANLPSLFICFNMESISNQPKMTSSLIVFNSLTWFWHEKIIKYAKTYKISWVGVIFAGHVGTMTPRPDLLATTRLEKEYDKMEFAKMTNRRHGIGFP